MAKCVKLDCEIDVGDKIACKSHWKSMPVALKEVIARRMEFESREEVGKYIEVWTFTIDDAKKQLTDMAKKSFIQQTLSKHRRPRTTPPEADRTIQDIKNALTALEADKKRQEVAKQWKKDIKKKTRSVTPSSITKKVESEPS